MATTIPKKDRTWTDSLNAEGWQYALLSGSANGPFTALCRCRPRVAFQPCVSNGIAEFYVLSGRLCVNSVSVDTDDYACVPPGVDCDLRSASGMEALCVVHGKAIYAEEVLDAIVNESLPDQTAKELMSMPWIEHLRRHTNDKHVSRFVRTLASTAPASVKSLCVSAARNVASDALVQAARAILQTCTDVSLSTSATLYLASKGFLSDDEWDRQLKFMQENRDTFLKLVRLFYSAASNEALTQAVRERIESGKYDYNKPFYRLVIHMVRDCKD